jgi:hypothetical protein
VTISPPLSDEEMGDDVTSVSATLDGEEGRRDAQIRAAGAVGPLASWQERAGLGNGPRTILEEFARLKSHDVVLPPADQPPREHVKCSDHS